MVDTVERQEIDVVQPQILHRSVERAKKVLWVGHGGDLRLDDDPVARKRWEDAPELHFRGAVTAGGLDVVDPEVDSAVDRGLQIGLV